MKLNNCIYKTERKSVYVEDGMAIKVFSKDYSKTDVLYEALNTSRVEDSGMEIPKLLEVCKENGHWMIINEYIEGKTLAELMQENPDQKSFYLEKMVDLQTDFNQKQNPLLIKLKDKLSRQIQSCSQISDSIRYELLTRLESMPKHKKLCHGDFCPQNIIVTNEKKFYIVDWVHATQGNASADVARTYLLLALSDISMADEYLSMFCKKTATDRKYVQQWLPIVAAAQLEKNRPAERELLLHWVDIVDFE